VQAKGICNIFNKIVTENFPTLKKVFPIQVQKASRTPNRFDQNRTSPQHIIVKTISTDKEKILKAVREKKQIKYKGKPIKITLKARRAWSEVFQTLNENNFTPRICYPGKQSFRINGVIKDFPDK
jgi:hypothetical protein